ncbi:L-rhamnose mutarotase [Pseudoalteromonas phenolica]|uniref:L-rhamnose mutarotase n=1 Tax=Pseudoalteromonas phenolica TaxID=161398 RepID=UPI001F4F245E|nr:L-rhamnose mutarotase [Pseudoalteromonas phenolica]
MNNRFVLALDLKDDELLIEQYVDYHRPGSVWAEVIESIEESGIEVMEIYLVENRLVMVMEANESFSFSDKQAGKNDDIVKAWEVLMSRFQQTLPSSKKRRKVGCDGKNLRS